MGEHKPGFLLRHLFLRQLPAQVQAALAHTTITDCCALAEEADCFFLARRHQGSTSSGFSTDATVVPGFDLAAAAPVAVPVQDTLDFTTTARPPR